MVELYWISGSPFAWRVQLALELKCVAYQSRLLERSKGEHKSAEFLALNPKGQVPVLRDGDVVVRESLAILAYLDRAYPEPPIFGRTAGEAGAVWQEALESGAAADPFERFILPLYFGEAMTKEAQVRAALPQVTGELDRLEQLLIGKSWLVGAALSAADIAAYPMVRSVVRAAEKPEAARFDAGIVPMAARRPNVAAWMARIEALPGYQRTFPPHWR